MWRSFAFGLGLAAVPLTPLVAQTDGPPTSITPEEAVERERQVYGVQGPPPPRQDCDASTDSGEIVVCARKPTDSSRYRVKSTAQLDPNSRQNLYDGLPRAPDLGPPPCTGVCVRMGKVPPPALIIDLKAIPEPPPGSDADKISKGEMAAP